MVFALLALIAVTVLVIGIAPLTPKDDLARILTWQETRSLSENLTLQFYKTVYQIRSKRPSYALRNAQVVVISPCQRRHLHPV